MGRDFLILGYPQVPGQGCPDHMALNADLTSDDTFLLNNTLKEVCVTPIQLAYYLFFFSSNQKFHSSTQENLIYCSQHIFLTWRHLANEYIELQKEPAARLSIKGKWITLSAFWLIFQDYKLLRWASFSNLTIYVSSGSLSGHCLKVTANCSNGKHKIVIMTVQTEDKYWTFKILSKWHKT